MDDISFVFLLLAALVVITRPFTALFHELGHAIPALLLTREKVTIYIGSYGDRSKGARLRIGLLEIWFRYNLFSWKLGLCVPAARDISVNRQLVYTLAGPIASFVIAGAACYLTFVLDLHGFMKLLLLVSLGCAIFDLLVNLIPSSAAVILFDGSKAYNDGYVLKTLVRHKRLSKVFQRALDAYSREAYKEAAALFAGLLKNGLQEENLLRLCISSHMMAGEYKTAKEQFELFSTLYQMSSDDCCNAGHTYSRLGLHEQGIVLYEKSLQLDPGHKYALNNMGYTLNLLGRYEEAITLLDRAIEQDVSFAHPYNNRGFAKLKVGLEAGGLSDIKHSLLLEPDNSYGYLNLGIYHLDIEEYEEALRLFRKAKQLDATTHRVDELIEVAEIRSEISSTKTYP